MKRFIWSLMACSNAACLVLDVQKGNTIVALIAFAGVLSCAAVASA